MRNIIFTVFMLLAAFQCFAATAKDNYNQKKDSSETGAVLIDFRKNIIIAERITNSDSFKFNAASFDFAVEKDTTYIEATKTDTHLWKIMVFKDWDAEIINQATQIDSSIKKIKQEKNSKKQLPVSLKCLDSPLVVKYDSQYKLSFIGADFRIEIPGDTNYFAKSDLTFFSSSPYEKESYKIPLFNDKHLVIGQVTGLLSEFNSKDESYIDHSHFFWIVTK